MRGQGGWWVAYWSWRYVDRQPLSVRAREWGRLCFCPSFRLCLALLRKPSRSPLRLCQGGWWVFLGQGGRWVLSGREGNGTAITVPVWGTCKKRGEENTIRNERGCKGGGGAGLRCVVVVSFSTGLRRTSCSRGSLPAPGWSSGAPGCSGSPGIATQTGQLGSWLTLFCL